MLKNVIIAFLLITTIFFVVLSRIKMNEAEKEKTRADANLELAEHRRLTAEAAEAEAEKQAASAIREKRMADEARKQLDICQNK